MPDNDDILHRVGSENVYDEQFDARIRALGKGAKPPRPTEGPGIPAGVGWGVFLVLLVVFRGCSALLRDTDRHQRQRLDDQLRLTPLQGQPPPIDLHNDPAEKRWREIQEDMRRARERARDEKPGPGDDDRDREP